MKHSELIATITKQTGKEPKQRELATILDKPVNTISARASKNLRYSYDEVEKLEDYYKVNFSNQDFIDDLENCGGMLRMDYFPDVFVSCGNGTYALSDIKYKIDVPKRCVNGYKVFAKYSVINAHGDSMSPTIQDGDLLIVEHCEDRQIKDDNVYVFCYNDKLFTKRLALNINQLIIKSDNQEYDQIKIMIDEEHEPVHIIGRVAGLLRNKV